MVHHTSPQGDCNTESRPIKRKAAYEWFITYFPKLPQDICGAVEHFKKYFDKYIFQVEACSTSGRLHLQGYVANKIRKESTTLKNEFPGIHLEKPRSKQDCIDYCSKIDTRIGDTYVKGYSIPYTGKDLPTMDTLYLWQKKILKIINEPADTRKIYWFYSKEGNLGKSKFCKYLSHHYNYMVFETGKKGDIINGIFNADITDVILFDFPRCTKISKIDYGILESFKNGCIFNTKFETGKKLFNPPHIFVFANEEPDKFKMSLDRWEIIDLHPQDLPE